MLSLAIATERGTVAISQQSKPGETVALLQIFRHHPCPKNSISPFNQLNTVKPVLSGQSKEDPKICFQNE